MTNERDGRVAERVDSAWRRFAARPASLPPAEAARRVMDRLPAQPAGVRLRTLAFAAAVALILVSAWLISPPRPAPVREVLSVPPPLPENVVQWWLDDETPVYFVLSPSDSQGGV